MSLFNQPTLTIVGAGDVVASRLFPALLKSYSENLRCNILHGGINCLGRTGYNIRSGVVPTDPGSQARYLERYFADTDGPVIVATPPAQRLEIAAVAAASNHLVILEKPIALSADDACHYLSTYDAKKVFAMAYYCQSKALTWTAVMSHNSCFDKLVGSNIQNIRDLVRRSGRLREFECHIKEGATRSGFPARRAWYEDVPFGVIHDMGLHALHLLAVGCQRDDWSAQAAPQIIFSSVWSNESRRQFGATGKADSVEFSVEFGKDYEKEDCGRRMVARFDRCIVKVDFENGEMTVLQKHSASTTSLKIRYATPNYEPLIDLVRFFQEGAGFTEARFDCITQQVVAMRWLERMVDSLQ